MQRDSNLRESEVIISTLPVEADRLTMEGGFNASPQPTLEKTMDNETKRLRKNESQRRYKKSEKGKKTQSKYYQSQAKRDSNRRWRENPENKIKRSAHNKVFEAVKSGVLKKQPCEVCGNGAFAHHEDYQRPLEIRWLCNFHHTEHHRKILDKVIR